MDFIAIIISIIALVGAGFAFIRASSSHHILGSKLEKLRDKNSFLEERLRRLEGASSRGNRPANEPNESGRQKKQRPEQRQEPQPEQRQRQRERERPQPQPQAIQSEEAPMIQQQPQEQQPRRKKENRRRNEPKGRNEPMERNPEEETRREQQLPAAKPIKLEIAGGDLLDELEQAAGSMPPTVIPEAEPESRIRYAIIPEDGVIRMHQLQQRPDSDSYIEIDAPADGSSSTHYRFNLAGNHAFVIAQGIDRLENAFDFEKPSNRMVTKVVQQQDGVLTKVNNGWKIMEKARIDFR
ncbi:hypothetical protein [Pontibacter liquoris]|uniref:hypothetical protein n=1 Tax=Pontibacter liquoris TaxID=2905677 RepID=UPI001FA76830|nr:hypothetical protein [Pontibacter liquoris]